jgi:hypothetical protein
MNVAQMTMPKAAAKRKLQAVRKQLHRRADAEYQALESAYQAAAAGRPLISLSDAFATAPRDEKGRPRLAIARADRVQVHLRTSNERCDFRAIARGGSFWDGRSMRNPQYNVGVAVPGMLSSVPDGYALVPIVPPDVRRSHSLETHFILWEVEQWSPTQIGARPDRDPYLLKHLGGDLYAVIAEWDLTDIERAVMAGRARS